MKSISVLLVGLMVVATTSTFAQESPATTVMPETPPSKSVSQRGISLSVGPEFVVPVGTFRSETGLKFGLGGSAKLVLPLASNLDGTVSAGYIGFSRSAIDSVSSKYTFTTIPFKAGIRYRTNSGFYLEPQAGYTQTKRTNMESSGQFTYAINLGYLLHDMIDLSVRYEAITAQANDQTAGGATRNGVSAKMLGLRLAYSFNFARVK